MWRLTRDAFGEFKQTYAVYGTHIEKDAYRNEYTVQDTAPRGTIRTMFQPLTDQLAFQEYGADISNMRFAIVYEDTEIKHNDVITIDDDEYEVVGIKKFNNYRRIEVRRKKA